MIQNRMKEVGMSSDPDSALDHDRVLSEAFRVAFPPKGPRRMESYSAEKVFQLYFREWRALKEENVGLRQERDKYRDRMDALREENSALKAQIAKLREEKV
jgi:hypothetical protein